jgi:hypothetical protein
MIRELLRFLLPGSVNLDLKDGISNLEFVSPLEVVVVKRQVFDLGRMLPAFGSADLHTVKIRPVSAATVADPDFGRVQIEEAMLPRDGKEFQFRRQLDLAVLRTADKALAAILKFILLAGEFSVLDRQGNCPSHGPSSFLRDDADTGGTAFRS